MKKLVYVFLIAFSMTAFNSCREKTTGEKVEDAIEEAAYDTGDALEDAADEVKDAVN
jgi:predicted small secreted protein